MRVRLVRLTGPILMAAGLGCAPMGQLTLRQHTYFFDAAAFATQDDHTVLALSSETKPSWALRATTNHIWIVFPGKPVEGLCDIAPSHCSLRYARNLGLELGLICAAQANAGRDECEIPRAFGEWAESGWITVDRFIDGDLLEGHFAVTISSGRLWGDFTAHFDPLAAPELSRLPIPSP